MMTKRPHLTSLLPLLAAVTAFACGKPHAKYSVEAPATIRAFAAKAERLDVPRRVEIQGTVEANQIAAVSTRVMAMVTAVYVSTGQRVQRGQLLIDIDSQAAMGQLAQAKGVLSQAQATVALATRNYERFQALFKESAASELEVDMARMQYEQASGAVEQAEGGVAAASSVAADARVLAPFDGRVSRKMAEVGDLAAPGRPLLMIESEMGRRMVVSIPESLLHQANLKLGDILALTIDSRPDLGAFQGSIAEMASGADPASHSVQAKLDLPIPDLTTGAAGRAWVQTSTRSSVVIPRDAILRQGGLSLVVVRTAEGLAASRVVTVGQELEEDRIEVLSGLAGDETVLVGLSAAPAAGTLVETVS